MLAPILLSLRVNAWQSLLLRTSAAISFVTHVDDPIRTMYKSNSDPLAKTKKIDIFYWIPGTKPSSLQNLVPLQHSSIMQRFMIDDTKFINHCIDKYDRLTPVKGKYKV